MCVYVRKSGWMGVWRWWWWWCWGCRRHQRAMGKAALCLQSETFACSYHPLILSVRPLSLHMCIAFMCGNCRSDPGCECRGWMMLHFLLGWHVTSTSVPDQTQTSACLPVSLCHVLTFDTHAYHLTPSSVLHTLRITQGSIDNITSV